MRLWLRATLLTGCFATVLIPTLAAQSQQEPSGSHRKMVSKVVPAYPALARDMKIAGSVKIEATVAPNGTVKSASILGGHPLLAQSGADAVRRCKWESASHETKEIVILNFHPE